MTRQRYIRSLLATIFLSLFCAPASSQGSDGATKASKESPKLAVHAGRYSNYQYGFRFRIPKGMRGTSAPPPLPQHGLTIKLSKGSDSSAQIVAFAFYDGLEWSSLQGAVKAELAQAKKDSSEFVLRRRGRFRLGSLRAARLYYESKDRDSGAVDATELVVAYKSAPEGDAPIVYELWLETTPARYPKDKRTFDKILRTWKAIPIE
ncbi:MAG: hypothetical protein LC746_13210 [Acidobacteria bacterium]|nr:hypothetical protein [Acidobacteriota bacterium]